MYNVFVPISWIDNEKGHDIPHHVEQSFADLLYSSIVCGPRSSVEQWKVEWHCWCRRVFHFHTAPHVKHNFICDQNSQKITLGGKSSSNFLWHAMFFLYFLLFKLYVKANLTYCYLHYDGKGLTIPAQKEPLAILIWQTDQIKSPSWVIPCMCRQYQF
jgi:hypothetical protein